MSRAVVNLVVSGKVQGVGYRAWTVKTANVLKLSGWVRNLANGDVEILAVGDASALGELESQCAQGPTFAKVSNVVKIDNAELVSEAASDFGDSFKIIR